MTRVALRLVESPSMYHRDIEVDVSKRDYHSLHQSVELPGALHPELIRYCLDKWTQAGDTVLDPFCGSGATALESVLRGRKVVASDRSALAVRLSRAKLSPHDITAVTLLLQTMNLRRPVPLESFHGAFSPFFDPNTFRELVNLRAFMQTIVDKAAPFVQLIALSLLHGPSAGYFSVYTLPQISLLPAEQEALNNRRKQIPDYRAVLPRILRKAALILRDGIPSNLQKVASASQVLQADPRNITAARTESVNLVLTCPPIPTTVLKPSDVWLKNWFMGLPQSSESYDFGGSLENWLSFMNESLTELARVVVRGGRIVLGLDDIRTARETLHLDQQLITMLRDDLGRFFDVEGMLVAQNRVLQLKESQKERMALRSSPCSKLLVLRRR